jgi:NAD-dependent DNA ligase
MDAEYLSYAQFMGKARLDKAINSLLGLVEGVAIDGHISSAEVGFFRLWLQDQQPYRNKHPFTELVPLVEQAVADGVIDEEEREDIKWLCEQLRSERYFDATTADLQRLHAVMGGIVADGVVSDEELRGLRAWLSEHEHLRACWPYDEVDSLITAVLRDKRIDEKEQTLLKAFFSEFVAVLDDRAISQPLVNVGHSLVGLCAVCPEIVFPEATFCFTGASSRLTRTGFMEQVRSLGGQPVKTVTNSLNYLVIGAEGNPCYAYACYGRKVEKAVTLRRSGARIQLVHENDYHDAVADSGLR